MRRFASERRRAEAADARKSLLPANLLNHALPFNTIYFFITGLFFRFPFSIVTFDVIIRAVSRRDAMIITAGADISTEIAAKIMEVLKSGRVLTKSEIEELLSTDFSWPDFDRWQAEFKRIGYNSFSSEHMDKKEMLIQTIGSIYSSYQCITQGTAIKGLRWELSADSNSCPHCKSFLGKTFTAEDVPIPGKDTHPGCLCLLIPVLPE
jgi:hypothetical protein